jgi:hypothetical protein
MGKFKPWQLVLVVIALVAVGTSAYLSFGGEKINMAGEVMMVDLTTGDLYAFSLSGHKAPISPGKNPDSGKLTLMFVDKDPSGRWIVGQRDLAGLARIEGEPKALVDRKTGEVKVTGDKPKHVSR